MCDQNLITKVDVSDRNIVPVGFDTVDFYKYIRSFFRKMFFLKNGVALSHSALDLTFVCFCGDLSLFGLVAATLSLIKSSAGWEGQGAMVSTLRVKALTFGVHYTVRMRNLQRLSIL